VNLQELQTIRHYHLPVKNVVSHMTVTRQSDRRPRLFNGLLIGCTPESGVSFPDFDTVADTFGFPFRCCVNTLR
jgi:acetolactate synthase-1/2/3 large subunit